MNTTDKKPATVSNGVASGPPTVKSLLHSPAIESRFKQILGDKAPGFLSSVLNVVNGSTNLNTADPNSVIMAAAVAATLDLPINPNLGFAYIIPYQRNEQTENGWQTRNVAQFQMGYKGFIQLAKRSGQYLRINAIPVLNGQLKRYDPLKEEYEFDWTIEGGEVIGYVAYFKEINGFEKTAYWNVAKINDHAKKYSKSFGKKTSPWSTNYDDMARKTVLKHILSKYGTLSIEMQKAFTMDQSVVKDFDGNQYDYVDSTDLTGQPSIESANVNNAPDETSDVADQSAQPGTIKDVPNANDL